MLLDALWKSADPDEALNQFERFLSAAGPRAGLVELLADRPELLTGLVRVCAGGRSEEHTSELQSLAYLVCRLLLEKKKKYIPQPRHLHTNQNPLPMRAV